MNAINDRIYPISIFETRLEGGGGEGEAMKGKSCAYLCIFITRIFQNEA